MKVIGEILVFKNDKGYSTTISNKKEDGTYENMYITVNFRKDIEVPNKARINILDGFLSFYKTKEGLPKIKIVVLSFETEEEQSETVDTYDYSNDGLPF